jgi:hypothetical protein
LNFDAACLHDEIKQIEVAKLEMQGAAYPSNAAEELEDASEY